ncbi:glycoside hydrolase family 32 protein [Shouchella shacheensis]|uniref:glycoside hydrolase family 32 protein n=1 Tax=Shouchella shacheensis TaxID=1649580 RepID=UPI0009EBA633|nr:glycoside hydrolase family 32 protein [Shouchella shacheensis]
MEKVQMNSTHEERIKQATEAVREQAKTIDSTYRLGYHLMAPSGWINDPNGLIFYKGEYHAFYQHHPYDATHGPMHWGHAKSRDLIHWEHLPVALAPGNAFDTSGCFSGSAVEGDDMLTLIYTGHNVTDSGSDEFFQNQNIARSKDGLVFEKATENPVIPQQPEGTTQDFRDPKVWKHGDKWYMVVGSTEKEGRRGQVLLYASSNLSNWVYLGVLAHSDGTEGYMWECPDFFELDGKHILLISPQGIEAEGERYLNHHQTGFLIGDFDYETLTYTRGTFTELDFGHDFYAVQTFKDEKGRRIAFGWMDMWESPMPTQAHGWSGAFTLPRELSMSNQGRLLMNPVEEVAQLRKEEVPLDIEAVQDEEVLLPLAGEMIELELSLKTGTTTECGVKLRCSEDGGEETVLSFHAKEDKLVLDRSRSGKGVSGIRTGLVEASESLDLRIFVDRSSVEVFVNGGETVLTSRIYPSEGSTGVKLFSRGGDVQLSSIRGYRLKDTWSE